MTSVVIHAGRRVVRTRDWGNDARQRAHNDRVLAEQYADLVERAWAALAEVKARAVTKDEDLGHEFHGNQWTGGLGAKPKTITSKASKAGVHELLSSGHPFTKAELMSICGIKTEKLLSDYLAMLKNPKYAGPKGALSIQSKDGHYYVALPDGTPAPAVTVPDKNGMPDWEALNNGTKPALPPHLAKLAAKMEANAGKASHTITEVHVPGYTEAAPEKPADTFGGDIPAVEPLTPAEKAVLEQPTSPYATAVMKLSGAHPGSLPKSEADLHYEQAMAAANVYLKGGISKATNDTQQNAAVLTWKNQKAATMAAWAQAVHGHLHAPKPQDLFKADKELGMQIASGVPMDLALTQWKSNTAAEKNGNFPAKPAAPATKAAKAAAAPVQVVTDMGHPLPVAPINYDDLTPPDSKQIAPSDFHAEPGAINGKWGKQISALKFDLANDSAASASDNKKSVEHKLRERLKDKPNFQALVKRLGFAKEGYASVESKLIAAWAGSSGDTHDISVALQLAVRDAFSIPDSHIEKSALNSLNKHGHNEGKVISAGIHDLNSNMHPLQPHEVQTAKHALMEFVQAQYHETQEYLAAKGHDHVYLARGMKVHAEHDPKLGPANLKLQPASSFSVQYSTAKAFSGNNGTVFLTKVPRQQVLSTYMTGFGCTSEHEVVVLAHNKLKAFTVAGINASGHQQAASLVQSKLGAPSAAEHAQTKADLVKHMTAGPVKHSAKSKAALANGDHGAALKTAVINAKSKAYKAVKAAQGLPVTHPKVIHAVKAQEEAHAAVKALAQHKAGGGK